MADEALQIVGQRDVFLVDESDGPVRMFVEGDAVQCRVAHVVKDEVHRGGVALAFLAELVAEAEAARVEVDVERGVLAAAGLFHDVVDEEVAVLDDHGLGSDVADGDFGAVVETAAGMRDEEDLAREEREIGERIAFMQVRHKPDVISFVEDVLLDVDVGELHVVEMDRRVPLCKGADEFRRQETQDAVGRHHAQEAFVLQAQLCYFLRRIVEFCHHAPSVLQEHLAVLRRHDALL